MLLPKWLKRWEGVLLLILVAVIINNVLRSPNYLTVNNLINTFELSIEKVIVVLIMTFVIINGEIDLSVSSIMGLAACLVAWLWQVQGVSLELACLIALGVGALCGAFNGLWIAYGGLPSLAVTLAGLIGYRGIARILLEDGSIGDFPAWFNDLGQQDLLGPLPLSLLIFMALFVLLGVVLHYSAFGRYVYVIGNNKEAARFSGINVAQVKVAIFTLSGLIAALAGVLYAARLGTVRANAAENFELDIITIVLLGGVNIFGGTGTLTGVGLSILVVLNLRNGLGLASITANVQTMVIGLLLILSVLIPNLAQDARRIRGRHLLTQHTREPKKEDATQGV